MSTISDDPLRFLKPRKKQFHLTPTKPNKQSSSKPQKDILTKNTKPSTNYQHNKPYNSSYLITQSTNENNYNNKQIQSIKNNIQLSSLLTEHSNVMMTYQKKVVSNIINNNKHNLTNDKSNKNNSKLYNPQKYFSLQVENYLRKKRGMLIIKNNQNQQRYKQDLQYQGNKKSLQNSNNTNISQQQQQQSQNSIDFIRQIQSIKIQQKQQRQEKQNVIIKNQKQSRSYKQIEPTSVTSVLLLQTKHDKKFQYQQQPITQKNTNNQQTLTQYNKRLTVNQNQQQQVSFDQKLDYSTNNMFTKQTQSQKQKFYQQQDDHQNYQTDQLYQLKPCPLCNRKFNPSSYQKHVKVCQKVFYKKRKQFSSQKQRSLSNKRK